MQYYEILIPYIKEFICLDMGSLIIHTVKNLSAM